MPEYQLEVFIKDARRNGIVFREGLEPGVFVKCTVSIPANVSQISEASALIDEANRIVKENVDYRYSELEVDDA